MQRPKLPDYHDPDDSSGAPWWTQRRGEQDSAGSFHDPIANEPVDSGGGSEGGGDGGGRPPRPPRRRRRGRRIIGWGVFALVALLVLGGGYAAWAYFTLTSSVNHVDAFAGVSKPKHDVDGGAQNILLVGDDHRPSNISADLMAKLHSGPDDGENNTDTMMILHVPADGSSATVISLPRDSWVAIPGNGHGKLNSAYADGVAAGGKAAGAKLLIETVQNLTGLTIDHYAQISLLGFYNIAEALGPIDVCLNQAVNDPYSGANFPAGKSTLNAAQALAFVRQRHGLPMGDLDREVRQQYFLSVEAHKLLSAGTLLNPVKLHDALTAIGSSITTDPGLDLLSLATQVKGLSSIKSATIPVSGTPTIYVDGDAVSIVEVDTAAMPAFIQHVIGNTTAYDKATPAKPADVTVTVLNGGGTEGAAGDATRTLAAVGFHTGTPGNTDSRSATVIQYPAGSEAQAKAVAAHLAGAVTQQTSVKGVTVLLGSDGVMPSEDASGASAGAASRSSTSGSGSSGSGSSGSGTSSPPPTKNYSDTVCIN